MFAKICYGGWSRWVLTFPGRKFLYLGRLVGIGDGITFHFNIIIMKKFMKPLLSIILVALLVIVGIWLMPVSCEKQSAEGLGPSQESRQGPGETGTAADTSSA